MEETAHREEGVASTHPAAAPLEALRDYARRGVFQGYADELRGTHRGRARFRWFSGASFRVDVDAQRQQVVFRDLLPGVPYPSEMDRALRRFLASKAEPDLPAHRRFDPHEIELRCTNRNGHVSVTLTASSCSLETAARRGVSLVNEIFHGFLRGPYFDYMVEFWGEPEE